MANEGFILTGGRPRSRKPEPENLTQAFLERAEKRPEYAGLQRTKLMSRDERALTAIDRMTKDECDTQKKVGLLPNQDAVRRQMENVAEIVEKKKDNGELQNKEKRQKKVI